MLGKNIFALFASLAFAGGAMAQPAPSKQPVELTGEVKLVKTITGQDGKQRTEQVAPDVVVPGDRLVFSTTYRNAGAEPATNFVVRNAVPGPVRLADDADPGLVVSIDGGKTWGTLGQLKVTAEGGVSRDAQAADVTHIRWTLAEVKPGESGRVEYQAIIR